MSATAIEWTNETWNPTVGCTRVSPGCEHCYAEQLAPRLAAMGQQVYDGLTRRHQDGSVTWTGEVRLLHERLAQPARWKKPRRIFVNSMSDLFHESVPDGFLTWLWLNMAHMPQHTFQILTKRPKRMLEFVSRWSDLSGENGDFKAADGPDEVRAKHPSGRGQLFAAYLEELFKASGNQKLGGWPCFDWMEGPRWWTTRPLPNVWLGVSAENQETADERIPLLLQTPAVVRFVSAEPLLGPVDFSQWMWALDPPPGHGYPTHKGPDWIITGGESGPNYRSFDPQWARDIRDECAAAGVAFFFKQHGGRTPKAGGCELDGREWKAFPGVGLEAWL